MRAAAFSTALIAIVASATGSSTTDSASANLFLVAANFIWVENLAFIPANSSDDALFAADRSAGTIYRITRDAASGNYSSVVHLAAPEIAVVLGLSVSDDGETLYGCASLHNDTNFVLRMGTARAAAGAYTILTYTPDVGNGMRLYNGQLYVSTEGNFLPNTGQVWRIDAESGALTTLSDGKLWAADGLWISSSGVLYVGQLFARSLWRYEIATGASSIVSGPASGWLDDFTLDEWSGGGLFNGANFEQSRIDRWWVNGTLAPPAVASGIKTPTSCRFGPGTPSFPATSLYISEGGGLFPSSPKERHVWELRGAR